MPGLVVAVLHHKSGLARDNCVNTFAFNDDFTVGATRLAVAAAVQDFYNGDADAAVNDNALKSVGGIIGTDISRVTPVELKMYDLAGHLDGSPHGSAAETFEFTLDAETAATRRPAEVGIALSFRGDYGAAQEELANPNPPPVQLRPRSRKRGRVFIGPLTNYAGIQVDGPDFTARPSTLVMACIGQAGTRLRNNAFSTWCVWSRTDQLLYPVTTVSVDNSFDTQRRRGPRALARTVY